MGKSRAVCKDVLICFYLAITIQTLDALYKEKTLSVLPNKSIVKNSSSYPTILRVAGLKGFVILISKSQKMTLLNSGIIKGDFPSI